VAEASFLRRFERPIVLFAAVLGVVVTARLGLWQLDRAAQKERLQVTIDARRDLPALNAAALAREPAAAAEQHHRTARLTGTWLTQATVFLDNRQMNGRPGFVVVTPLQLDDGAAVLVQRGWLPRDPRDRTRLPALETPSGAVTVHGRLAPPPSRLHEFEPPVSGPIRQNLELDGFARETGLRLRPMSLQQAGDPAADGLQRDWPRPLADVHKHYGYAFQWFALATLITGLYVWFQLLGPRRRVTA
jgi:surfeit locus 1 family protein